MVLSRGFLIPQIVFLGPITSRHVWTSFQIMCEVLKTILFICDKLENIMSDPKFLIVTLKWEIHGEIRIYRSESKKTVELHMKNLKPFPINFFMITHGLNLKFLTWKFWNFMIKTSYEDWCVKQKHPEISIINKLSVRSG